MSKDDDRVYWASVPAADIADEILEKVDQYYMFLNLNGRMDLYRRSWAYYYRARITGGKINPTGQQGELTALSCNQYRNLLLHLEVMTTQQQSAPEPRATNTDDKSQAQTILATTLLDYYLRDKHLDRRFVRIVKEGLLFGEGFIRVLWDVTGGEVYGTTENGAPIYQGDVKYKNYMPIDVIRDFTKLSPNQDTWFIMRDFENKYDLAAKYPALEKDILDDFGDLATMVSTTTLNALALVDSDNIPVYCLIHEPTPSMPQGRYTEVLDNGTVLLDGPLPYSKAHVYRLTPDEEEGTCFGYSVAFDLMPVQEMLDILYSTSASNISATGVQNILVPKGHDISTQQLTGGLNVTEYDPKIGKPEAMQLCATAPEVYNFMAILERIGETLSGASSVVRGNPEASLKSGAALALVQSMAIQFNMNLQRSYIQIQEDVFTATIQILQDFAKVPRIAAIVGKSNRPLMKEFVGKDLEGIDRVLVDVGNPLTNTTAGKINLADALMEKGMIQNPAQYIQVLTTGRLEPVYEGQQAQNLLIKAENEEMSRGMPQVAIITDFHAEHVMEHQILTANPEARRNPALLQVVLDHIQQHLDLAQQLSPELSDMLKQKSYAPPPAPAAQPGQMLNPNPPVVQQAQGVKLPNMPNPPQGADPMSADIINSQAGRFPQK
jgi:hypothetical protein